jgi:hypothetical protein
MTRSVVKLSALIMVLLALAPALAQERTSPPRSIERFDGKTRVRVRDPQGQTQIVEVNVRIQNWAIEGRQKVDALPLQASGLMIVQLRGGELTTVIGGKRQERKEGEFWTVLPGAPMGAETKNDTASFQTIMVSDR